MESIEKLCKQIADSTSKSTFSLAERDNLFRLIDGIEAEIERDYMRLPVDSDGVPIHVGDDMVSDMQRGVVTSVNEKAFLINYGTIGCNIKTFHHVKPRTLEDVLRDVWKEALDYAKSDMWRNPDEVFAERADEIRELLLSGDAS